MQLAAGDGPIGDPVGAVLVAAPPDYRSAWIASIIVHAAMNVKK